jgi:hypothetical protein
MSDIILVEIEDRYKPVTTDQDIQVSVKIGNAQEGASIILLEQTFLSATGSAIIGKASMVLRKRTIVSATVVDIRDQTNHTSVTVTVTEDGKEKHYGPYSKKVAKDKDTVCYLIEILNTNDV